MCDIIQTDDQPIAATFFGEGKWLTDFITPEALEIQQLYDELTAGIVEEDDRIIACWEWVGNLKYKNFITGKLWIEGQSSVQTDLWNTPSITARIKVGNCSNKSFLLTSLLRNELPAEDVHCVLGNLHNGRVGGHAWVLLNRNGEEYIMEATSTDVPPLVFAHTADRYEAIHLFNDKDVYTIPGKTVMTPYSASYSVWLKEYLDWAYIEGKR